MRGFDPEFDDIIDYILRITYRIWEGKQVDLCHKYYSEDCPVYTLAGLTVGAQEVTDNTAATQAAFPDRTLRADAIICGGNDVDGFHTSHLIHSEMTNLGASDLGPATGRPGAISVIAHCIVKDNRIIEEWLVRDNLLLVQQLGFDVQTIAQQKASLTPAARDVRWRDGQIQRLLNTAAPAGAGSPHDSPHGQRVRTALEQAWTRATVEPAYAADATVHISAGKTLHGVSAIRDFYAHMHGTLSSIRFSIDYLCEQPFRVQPDDTPDGKHVAARWTLLGLHTGDELYGTPTNEQILIMGESHCHVNDHHIETEWTVFDELAVLTQIERARASQNIDEG